MSTPWKPPCEGKLAADLRASALEIGDATRDLTFTDPTLGRGSGIAILFAYLAQAFPDHGFDALVAPRLEAAIDQLSAQPSHEGFFGGFTGVAWSVEHVTGSDVNDDSNDAIDDVLLACLTRTPWNAPYDLISGLVGIGIYALERLPRPNAILMLGRIIDRLEEMARPCPEGLTWWTDPRHSGTAQEKHPEGIYNLGVAHGVPGIIALLGRASAVPELAERVMPIIRGATAWVLSLRLPAGPKSCFGWCAEEPHSARTAWCYGDLGVAAALMLAARSMHDVGLERLATEIALDATDRRVEDTAVVDSAVCHGRAGIAHLYNRFYQSTGNPRFAEATRVWFQRTLDDRYSRGPGIAGFMSYTVDSNRDLNWLTDGTLLTGTAGIALTMLSAFAPIVPDWDRLLLCSIPPLATNA